jgi:hypothetical protein
MNELFIAGGKDKSVFKNKGLKAKLVAIP